MCDNGGFLRQGMPESTRREAVPPRAMGNAWNFSWSRHFFGLAPLLMLTAGVLLVSGGESSAADVFRRFSQATEELRPIVVFLTRYGNIPFYVLIAHAALFSRTAQRKDGLRFVLCYLVIMLLLLMVTDTLKIWIGRPRPGEPGEYVLLSLERVRHSFPSNHMAETTFTAMTLAHCRERRRLAAICGTWLAVMGFTRMYLGRHHPTDLIGSAVLGSLAVYYLYWQTGRTDHYS